MSLNEYCDLEKLRNRSAQLVFRQVERFLEQPSDFCRCEQCVLDLAAFVLNHVTPLYGTSLLDPFHPDPAVERKVNIEIDLALRAGARKVRLHPNHD